MNSRAPSQFDFRELRRVVSIELLLERRGLLTAMRARGGKLIGPCPIHGGDNPTAFVVDRRRNLWFCHSTCRAGGDIIELVRRLDRVDYRQSGITLAQLAEHSGLVCLLPEPASQPAPFRPYRTRLHLEPQHPFLRAKGIHPSTAARFEVGAWPGRGMLQGCVGVRIHDPAGLPLGYAGRRLSADSVQDLGKWVFPKGMPKRRLLYGWHRVPSARVLVVVECPWGVLRLHQIGVPAVALLGTSLFDEQAALLQSRRIVIMFDADTTGRAATAHISKRLAASAIRLPDGCDPDDLSDPALRALLRNTIPQVIG